MSTMTFDAAGIAGVREATPVKQVQVQHRAPRQNPVHDLSEVPAAPSSARRTRTPFGLGSAVSFECDNWMRWTGV